MNFQNTCLENCAPAQIINLNMAFNTIDNIKFYNDCNEEYSIDKIQFAYSIDNVCWSCYMNYMDFLTNTVDLHSDFYIRAKISGIISKITVDGVQFYDYTTSIASGFTFSYCSTNTTSSNLYNPYANMECAIALQQQLTENVACLFGIPIYYFKLSPNVNSKDITFKEYALMDVESVKQIKMIINDNQMPSSKPEFSDLGIDFQTDWETEISKGMFATAFGTTAQPTEGDLIYVPMMKRMWMVNEAYEEKKDAFMWNSTTFKVFLVKYQEKASVNLNDTEELVQTFTKNKYDDLFGDQEDLDSGVESVNAPLYAADNLKPIYESDATRKYVTCDGIDFFENNLYYKGTLISNNCYNFITTSIKSKIIYQRQYCGTDCTISFIITGNYGNYTGKLLQIGTIQLSIKQSMDNLTITLDNCPKCSITINNISTYFVYFRWNKSLNNCEAFAAIYTHVNMPKYRLQNHHYYFDIDNPIIISSKYNIELVQDNKNDIILNGFLGKITNIKIYDQYIDNVSEILQMYPTHQHLLINDTARKIVDLTGVTLR